MSKPYRDLERPSVVMGRARYDVGNVAIPRSDEHSWVGVVVHTQAFLLAAKMQSGHNPSRIEVGGKDMLDHNRRQIFHVAFSAKGASELCRAPGFVCKGRP